MGVVAYVHAKGSVLYPLGRPRCKVTYLANAALTLPRPDRAGSGAGVVRQAVAARLRLRERGVRSAALASDRTDF